MATSSSPTSKRNSLHRLSNIFQLTSPSFSRTSFDPQPQRNRLTRNRPSPKPSPSRTHHSQTTSISSSVTLGTHDRDNTLAQTASILSSSTLASSHTPLLDSEPPKSPGPVLPVPPTTNDLAAEEKMKLVKKSRKISRVLGEVPVPSTTDDMPELYSPKRLSDVPEDPFTSSRPTSPTLNIQTVSASAKKAFRRSMTFGAGSLQVPEVQRSKSTSALRPALQLSTAVPGDEHEHSYSPILFAANDAASDDDAENMEDVIPPSVIEAPEDDADSSESSSPPQTAHAASNSQYGLSVEETRERIQRQRMERLARILGEGVPPDVLRRAASPSPEDASASPMYHAGDASRGMSMEHLPQRSTSLRAKINPRRKRPQSLDFKNIRNSGALSAPVTPLDSPSGLSSPGIRRAMSTQARISGTAPITDSVPSQNVEVDGPSAEKQRILNVKRAKKLTQLFGDNPPTALFQITNFGSVIESGDLLDAANSDIHRHQRDSLATIISISSLSGDASLRLRDSFISVVTSNSDISAAILTSEVEGEPGTIPEVSETAEGPTMAQPEESEPTEAPSKSLDIPVVVAPAPLGANVKRSSSSPYPARPPSPNPQARSKLNVTAYPFQPPRTPPTPPPFSNFILSPSSTENFMAPRLDTTVEPAAHAEPSSDDFRARRRRAAKLSRFFGVEVNTLVDHLPNETSPLRSSRNGPYHFPQDPLPVHPGAVYGHSAGIPSVTVAQARGRYADQDDVEELDMSEVIDKLRKMKSS